MKRLIATALLALAMCNASAIISLGPWTPIFKGVDLIKGTNTSDSTIASRQVTRCVRIDLNDPDVQLFATPRAANYQAEYQETTSLAVSNFLTRYSLQVASDANFYNANPGAGDPTSEGVPCEVEGLSISEGVVVSPQDNMGRYCTLLFTTNKQASLVINNLPPGTNTAGIYTAITGFYPVLSNGVNVSVWAAATYLDSTIHTTQPRTAIGLSQNRRYLYMMTIDGRQSGYSDGANDNETAIWGALFSIWDLVIMDGGGSTSMYMADAVGSPVALNHSSYIGIRNRERYVGAHFGVRAKPVAAYINDVESSSSQFASTITWTTIAAATTQMQYGMTMSFGSSTPLDPSLSSNHTAVITGLNPGTTYYYQIMASDGSQQYTALGSFTTLPASSNPIQKLFDVTNTWKFNYANLDGVGWTASNYDDSGWPGSGPGLFWADKNGINYIAVVTPKNTLIPTNTVTSAPYVTYYFRTHFTYTNPPAGTTLTFTNFVDDGAVFYLNGARIYNLRVAVGALNAATATGFAAAGATPPDYGNASINYPDVFTISGDLITNLVKGDNVLAVEVHNYRGSQDITFGSALYYQSVALPSSAPILVTQPTSQVVGLSSNVTLVVIAAGDPPLSYQWRFQGAPIASANNYIYALTNFQPANVGDYDVIVSNVSGVVTSTVATLTINVPLYITRQPTNVVALITSNVTFSVAASGAPTLGYQWFKNSTLLSGQNATNLLLTSVQLSDEGAYSVVVTNATGSATSLVASLTVNIAPSISQQPTNVVAMITSTVKFTVAASGKPAVAYQWRKNGSILSGQTGTALTLNSVVVANEGDYSVVVSNVAGVLTSAVATLTVVIPPSISQQPTNLLASLTSNATFTVTASGRPAVTYQWRFNGTNLLLGVNPSYTVTNTQPANAGNYDVVVANSVSAITSTVAKLTLWWPPTITLQPTNQTVRLGDTASFMASASGNDPLSYQWYLGSTALTGQTNTILQFTNAQAAIAGIYQLVVTNSQGQATSSNALLRVLVAPQISPPSLSGTDFLLSLSTLAGLRYTAEYKTNIDDPQWVSLSTITNGVGTLVITNTATNFPGRFFRIRVE